jgi:phosphoribosylformimino-5-aminoimidazole carboxamide ribotide isomerase
MHVIGVVDIRAGVAVHARRGDRAAYQPVAVARSQPIDGDPVALAQFYRDRCGLSDVYIADLDAIAGMTPQHPVVSRIAALGVRVWVDAAIDSVPDAHAAVDAGAAQVVIGLETLTDFGVLGAICSAVGPDRAAFSLDLKEGRPLIVNNRAVTSRHESHLVELIATQAVQAGARRMIVLDLARVGTGRGIDVDTLSRVASCVPQCEIYAGGGVASADDLRRLDELGAAGALIATALIEGRMTPDELDHVRGAPSARRRTAR